MVFVKINKEYNNYQTIGLYMGLRFCFMSVVFIIMRSNEYALLVELLHQSVN